MNDETEASPFTVPKQGALSQRSLDAEYLGRHRPVVSSGQIDRWGALSHWSPQFFRERFPDREFELDGEQHLVRDFVDAVVGPTSPRTLYLRQRKLKDLFPELLPDADILVPFLQPNWLDGKYVLLSESLRSDLSIGSDFELLFGGAGSGFPSLHYDVRHLHAFIFQIYGEKEVTLFSPDQGPCLYPQDEYPNKSRLPVDREPDLDEFPLFARAKPVEATLRPGEVLFIPSGWWHSARNPTVSIALTANTANSANWWSVSSDIYHERKQRRPLRAGVAFALLAYAGACRTLERLFLL